jgi:hypothetical protein
MFRPLLDHHQVYCLCLAAELVLFNMDPYFEYDYVAYNTRINFWYYLLSSPIMFLLDIIS